MLHEDAENVFKMTHEIFPWQNGLATRKAMTELTVSLLVGRTNSGGGSSLRLETSID
jgi:hypothetical protein